MEEALQWWCQKKIKQLEFEANLIRDQLLQESFAMRRNLELSSISSGKSVNSHQKCVEQLESFHHTLKDLSDRLFPPCANEELFFALQYSVKKWQEQFPSSHFELDLSPNWQQKSQANNFIILNILEDLLQTQLSKRFSNNVILIELKQKMFEQKIKNILKITLTNQKQNNSFTLEKTQELQHIKKAFECLTSGSCEIVSTKDSNIYTFKW